jgi:hypothetical protein
MNLSSGYMSYQIECIRRAETQSRLALLKNSGCCNARPIVATEGTVSKVEPPQESVYFAKKVEKCPVIVSNISSGAISSGIYLRNKQLSCDADVRPLQVVRPEPPTVCEALPPESRNAGMPIPQPFLPCVPHIVGFT